MPRLTVKQQSLTKAINAIGMNWQARIMQSREFFERQGTVYIKNSIRWLRVYDTGQVDKMSQMTQEKFGNNIVWKFTTDNTGYAIYPRNGLGTSREYGARKYDIRAATLMLAKYRLRANVPTYGRPRPFKERDVRIPPQINL